MLEYHHLAERQHRPIPLTTTPASLPPGGAHRQQSLRFGGLCWICSTILCSAREPAPCCFRRATSWSPLSEAQLGHEGGVPGTSPPPSGLPRQLRDWSLSRLDCDRRKAGLDMGVCAGSSWNSSPCGDLARLPGRCTKAEEITACSRPSKLMGRARPQR